MIQNKLKLRDLVLGFMIFLLIGSYFQQNVLLPKWSLDVDERLSSIHPDIYALNGSQLEFEYNRYVSENEVDCKKSVRIGNVGDGGWDVCVDGLYLPRQPCLVYSFGIKDDWSFDDGTVSSFNCTVRAFDPSITSLSPKRNESIYFYSEGLAGSNKNNSKHWKLRTLNSFREMFNEQNSTIDYLKIDIESYEWESMDTAVKDGSLRNVKQIGVEFHRTGTLTKEFYLDKLNTFARLHDAGFRKWRTHLNVPCGVLYSDITQGFMSICNELYYLNLLYS
ncbi:hypothetical protein HELRODRAFT_167589 [Helobdella robusta]|uniref:Methyltransferase domain-containing protein n=1 Tax=Helobdella robusta TaxID=6412 RepID=T1EZI9_HELRO|nr:hypothetical protein HELRODRAFT_167589 [Helobdella robusta]ESO11064.1 hypothetical protein HELRODRAFT_167589 [Helobdella robusta]